MKYNTIVLFTWVKTVTYSTVQTTANVKYETNTTRLTTLKSQIAIL